MENWLREFRAECKVETDILRRMQRFFERHREESLGSEIAGGFGHITATAWITDPENSQVLLVWGRKEQRWQLPGAHGDGDLADAAKNEAARALGRVPVTRNPPLWSLAEREIACYWNTPAHWHFEMIFLFTETQFGELPRGARWLSLADAAQLGDEIIARLTSKSRG